MGNPFLKENKDLLVPDMKNIMDVSLSEIVRRLSHEKQTAPPSVSRGAKMRMGNKADLLHCLVAERLSPVDSMTVELVLMLFFIVQMFSHGTSKHIPR
jgi:hypothetical protein